MDMMHSLDGSVSTTTEMVLASETEGPNKDESLQIEATNWRSNTLMSLTGLRNSSSLIAFFKA
jgi:hypothetical protein